MECKGEAEHVSNFLLTFTRKWEDELNNLQVILVEDGDVSQNYNFVSLAYS